MGRTYTVNILESWHLPHREKSTARTSGLRADTGPVPKPHRKAYEVCFFRGLMGENLNKKRGTK